MANERVQGLRMGDEKSLIMFVFMVMASGIVCSFVPKWNFYEMFFWASVGSAASTFVGRFFHD